jgi:hypothetical protein
MMDWWSVILAWEACGLVTLAGWARKYCAVGLDALIVFLAAGPIGLFIFVAFALEKAEQITLGVRS